MTPEIVSEIARIAGMRSPHEACGAILLDRVFELTNHADDPVRVAKIDSQELVALLELEAPELPLHDLVVWHSHPRGNVGPSPHDMAKRSEIQELKMLVVALTPDGPISTMY